MQYTSLMIIGQRTLTIGQERYVYSIRRSRKAKHINVHVSVADGIELVVPWRVAVRQAESFLHEKQAWIAERMRLSRQLRSDVPRRQLVSGTVLPVLDQKLVLEVIVEPLRKRTTAVLRHNRLVIHVARAPQTKAVVTRWYRQQADIYFTDVTAQIALDIERQVTRISIGHARSQWGSCSAAGRLSFTWRLLLAPEWVARYVAVHEVAHLAHSNPSPAYWQLVHQLYDRTQKARAWLRRHGHELEL